MPPEIDIYYFPPSPPCRSVLMVGKALGIKFNLKNLNVLEGEHMSPDFVKINPQHTIPTINDNGLIIWESRPIMSYLVDMYGKDDSLYPKDPQQRVVVDQRLYFDMGTLYQRFVDYFFPVIAAGATPDPVKKDRVEEALQFLEQFLENTDWVAGNQMTIADIAIVVTIATAEAVGFDISKYPKISAWYERCQSDMAYMGYEDINQSGANMIGGMFRSKIR
nr:glutathione s-transferase delta-2 [Protohermes costalis]